MKFEDIVVNIKYYLRKAKDVNLSDAASAVPMAAAFICSPVAGLKYRNTWAISERKDEARDNGYHFYKYMTQKHPEQKCIYVIDKQCSDYEKVKNLGETVQFGSIRHWIMYFNCKYLISSQRFLPNAYMGTLIERMGLSNPRHVFLQHGITINKPEYLRADRWKVRLFTTATSQETEFIRKELGYQSEQVKCTGFARFDALHKFEVHKNRIMIMPTWRKWLRFKSEAHSDMTTDLMSSQYIREWKKLLQSDELAAMIEENGLEIVFIPHPNMKGLLNPADIVGDKITVADLDNTDLQGLMKTSEMIITDYSSVFFDMAYMKKPIIFFQFDENDFRRYHYEEGWFSYRDSHFGEVCVEPAEVIKTLRRYIQNGYAVSEEYLKEHKETFAIYDTSNAERIYKEVRNIR